MKTTTQEELEQLISFIHENHTGDYTAVSRDLYRTINYLHYLEADTIGIVELRNTCFTLYHLAESFFEAHGQRRKRYSELIEESDTHKTTLTSDDLWGYYL